MTEPQFMGHAVLHADKSPTDETDDPALPKKAGWSSREQSGDLNNVGHEGVYKLLSEIWDPALPNLYTVGGGWFRLPPPGFDFNGTDPVIEQEKTGLLSFGPYEMGPGEDVRIVLAFCGGMISNRLAIDAGRAYDSGYEGAYARIPMPYAVPGICEKGKLLTKDQKNQIIDSSRDILFSVASRAINNYKSSYGSGPLDIPMPPASPSIELTSMPGKIHLKWGDESASSTSDVAGYRIYRNYWRSPEITVPTDTTHILIADLSADKREYEDTDVIRGQQYWYYIAAYNSAGLESSRFLNRTSGQDEAVSPTKSPEPKWQNTAMVVPNPYHARAVRKYSGRRLLFVNLPAYCNIHVYTMTGDKVQTLRHKSGTGEEEWEEQLTFSNQRITSGIYFFVVEELDGPNGSDTGKITKGKFIVVN